MFEKRKINEKEAGDGPFKKTLRRNVVRTNAVAAFGVVCCKLPIRCCSRVSNFPDYADTRTKIFPEEKEQRSCSVTRCLNRMWPNCTQKLPKKWLKQFFLFKSDILHDVPEVGKYLGYFCRKYVAKIVKK